MPAIFPWVATAPSRVSILPHLMFWPVQAPVLLDIRSRAR
jgi:hypothetical protein